MTVTVQVLFPPESNEVGEHVKAVTDAVEAGNTVTEAVRETLLRVAVTVAVTLVEVVPGVAVKVVLVDPAGMVTDAGTVSDVELLLIATAVPPVGAAPVSATVQVDFVGAATEDGLQLTEFRPTVPPVAVTAPPVAVTDTASAAAETAIVSVKPTSADFWTVMLATATTPSEMSD